jgi:phosphoribosyl 1,2-cyclic phosphodiesterase
MHLTVLGSGSGGNSALITHGSTSVLVDAGLSASQLQSRLEAVSSHPDQLTAILLTHEHGDHVRGLEVLTKKFPVPIYCSALTRQVVGENFKSEVDRTWKVIQHGATFAIGELEIECFNVPHDAVDPMGFIIRAHGESLGFLSDLGHIPRNLAQRLSGVQTLFVEANYDGTLLQDDTKRPFSTKQRISSHHGHLSNHQTAEFLSQIAHAELERVVLGHLSSDCNKPNLAISIMQQALVNQGFPDVQVHCATQAEPTMKFPVRRNLPPAAAPVVAPVIPVVPNEELDIKPFAKLVSLPRQLVQAELF